MEVGGWLEMLVVGGPPGMEEGIVAGGSAEVSEEKGDRLG